MKYLLWLSGETEAYPLAGIPITSSDFWQNRAELDEEKMKYVFRSATDEKMPMLKERLECLREAGQVLYEVSCSSSMCSRIINAMDRNIDAAS